MYKRQIQECYIVHKFVETLLPVDTPHHRTIWNGFVTFEYKGGTLEIPWQRIHSILFYGAVCPLEEEFLQTCVRYGIPICIHRRHMPKAIWIIGNIHTNIDDILTKQILFKENKRKSLHIARKLLLAKVESMQWLSENIEHTKRKISFAKSVDELRNIEAIHAVKYWKRYFHQLGYADSERRNRNNDISAALNACLLYTSDAADE